MTPGSYIAVALGGMLGAPLRLFIDRAVSSSPGALPLGTLGINLVGSLALGLLYGVLALERDSSLTSLLGLMIGVGVLGSLTTFSAFSMQTLALIDRGQGSTALIYVLSSVLGGVLLAAVGYQVGNHLAP